MSAATTAQCRACGHELVSTNKFCPRCGTPQKPRMENAATPLLLGAQQHHLQTLNADALVEMPTKVSSKYAFAVVALCGLTATSFLIAGAFTPAIRSTLGIQLSLYDISRVANYECKQDQEKGKAALAFAIMAAIIAFGGTFTSAIGPLTPFRKLPFIGGIVLAVASVFALIAGAVAVSIYTEPLCGDNSPSSYEQLRIGSAPILLMLSTLPLILGAILSIVMRRPWTAEDEAATAAAAASAAQTVSNKFVFVVALSGLVALPLLAIGTASPVYEGTVCTVPSYTHEYPRRCSLTMNSLLDIAKDATCDSGNERATTAFAFGIIASATAFVGTLVSAASPFSTKPNLPAIGGAILGFGSVCTLIAGAIAVNLYANDTCFAGKPSFTAQLNVGPAPILLMLGVLPQAVAFIASLKMKETKIPDNSKQIKYDAATNFVKGPAAAMMVLSISTLALLIAAGLTKVYTVQTVEVWTAHGFQTILAAAPTLLHAAKHGTCKAEAIRGTVALVCLIAAGVGAGAGLVLGYSALVTGSRRFITYGGIVLCASGALAVAGGALAISMFTTDACYAKSLSDVGGSVGPSGILLLVSAFVLLLGSAATLVAARCATSSLQAQYSEELGFSKPNESETTVQYHAMQGKESDRLLPNSVV